MVRQESDPALDPQGVGDVSINLRNQPFKLTVAVGVDPQLAGSAATVTLPPGGFAGKNARQNHRLLVADLRPESNSLYRTKRKFNGGAAVEREAVGVRVAAFRLLEGTGNYYVARRSESLDFRGAVPEVAQLPVPSAVDVGRDDFRGRSHHDRPHQPFSIRGEPRVPCLKLLGGDPPGAAPLERCDPDVVFGHESDQIAVHMRETEVAGGGHCSIIVKRHLPSAAMTGVSARRWPYGEMGHAHRDVRSFRNDWNRPGRAIGRPGR
ncbi:hypothetical protein PJL18_04235 [Paenarthrobacter nicotinovorans]|nr:hypothetical protein [Paenarthrobacter nicotinovorans]